MWRWSMFVGALPRRCLRLPAKLPFLARARAWREFLTLWLSVQPRAWRNLRLRASLWILVQRMSSVL